MIEDSGQYEGINLESVAHTLQYAKFRIFLKDSDRLATESALWKLLQLPLTPFTVSLSSINALEEEGSKLEIEVSPFYKHLAGKYPK